MIKENKIRAAYIVLGLFFVFVFGFGAFFLISNFQLFSSLSFEEIFKKSLLKMQNTEEGKTKLTIKTNMEGKEGFLLILNTAFTKNNEESDFIISFENIFFVNGKMKKFEDAVYFNFSEINLSSTTELMLIASGIDIKEFVNIWIKVPQKSALKAQNTEEIREILYQSDSYFIKNEVIEMQDVYLYSVFLNNKTIIELFNLIVSFKSEEFLQDEEKVFLLIQNIEETSLYLLSKIEGIELEFSIDKENYFIYKVSAKKEIELGMPDSFIEKKVIFDFKIDNYLIPEPIVIELPEDYINFRALIEKEK